MIRGVIHEVSDINRISRLEEMGVFIEPHIIAGDWNLIIQAVNAEAEIDHLGEPYFHVIRFKDNRTEKGNQIIRIRLDTEEYVINGFKEIYKLSSDELSKIISFLKIERSFGRVVITNWDFCLYMWNFNLKDEDCCTVANMPDYSKLSVDSTFDYVKI